MRIDEFQVVELEGSPSVRELLGQDIGTEVSLILVDMPPGDSVRLHRHAYAEIFIIQSGEATYRIGAETLGVKAPRILVVPARVPHAFVNTGKENLKQVDIHLSPKFITDWLE
jgi:mannose-6-phosphate isomerase-like protein (cupin superfamily)